MALLLATQGDTNPGDATGKGKKKRKKKWKEGYEKRERFYTPSPK